MSSGNRRCDGQGLAQRGMLLGRQIGHGAGHLAGDVGHDHDDHREHDGGDLGDSLENLHCISSR